MLGKLPDKRISNFKVSETIAQRFYSKEIVNPIICAWKIREIFGPGKIVVLDCKKANYYSWRLTQISNLQSVKRKLW